MSMSAFVVKYGTKSTSIILRRLAEQLPKSDVKKEIVDELAKDLEDALNYFVKFNSQEVMNEWQSDL